MKSQQLKLLQQRRTELRKRSKHSDNKKIENLGKRMSISGAEAMLGLAYYQYKSISDLDGILEATHSDYERWSDEKKSSVCKPDDLPILMKTRVKTCTSNISLVR